MSTDLIIFLALIFQQEHNANKRRRTEIAVATTAITSIVVRVPNRSGQARSAG